jgi:DNA-binding response OmpR family regulator
MEIKTLLVEDQHPELQILLLQSCNGFDITAVRRGDHAVRAAKETRFDIIIMDLRLPYLDGLDATRQIRRFNPDIPIIIFTGYDTEQTRAAASVAGANAYFVKPVNYHALVLKIIELVAAAPSLPGCDITQHKQRRLGLLRQQQAIYGLDTPPHIMIEIQNLEEELR